MPVHSAFSRRHALALAVASVVSMAAPAAWAQDSWPTKPITFVVPQNPGGANDVIARAVAQSLENSLGQPVIVENRAGANGNVGTGQVARSAPDGYTFLVTAQSAHTINPALYSRTGFDPIKDFTPVMQLAVASDKPTPLAPEIPVLKDLAVTSWYGLFAPAGTPQPIIDKVYTEISRVLATPAMQERLKTLGAEPVQSNPQSFAASLPAELAHWKKVVDESGAKID